MSDTVKISMEQIDEDSSEAISRVTVEWFGNERNIANVLSLEAVQGVMDRLRGLSAQKAEITGSEEVKKLLGAGTTQGNPGAIRKLLGTGTTQGNPGAIR